MKIFRAGLLLAAGLLFGQCSKEGDKSGVTPKPDYDQISAQIMTQLAPQLIGTWRLKQLNVQAQRPNVGQATIGIRRDTVLQDFAVLTIRPAKVPAYNPADARYPDFEGDLTFRGQAYPVRFDARATDERMVNGKGPQAFVAFRFNLGPGSHPADSGRTYLQDLGLIDDNFSLEMMPGERSMVWRGLNRGIAKIDLQKQ